jgi:hypothetical protein
MASYFYMEDQLVKLQAILTVKMPINAYTFSHGNSTGLLFSHFYMGVQLVKYLAILHGSSTGEMPSQFYMGVQLVKCLAIFTWEFNW